MTDARRTDLNYGHFGEPVYDIQDNEWQFPRRPQDVPQLQRLGGSRLLIPPQLSSVSEDASQTAARRNRGIEQLVQAYPEFAPSSGLLPSLAEESEAIQKSTSDYDPAVSDVLAVGRAYHPLHHRRNANTTSVLALPGGAAGELVRVIQLVPDIIGWEEEPNIKLQDDRFHSRIQGLWYGNGSRIQQLQFAKLNGEPTEWLAVRYGGITSILRIILREGEVPTLYNIPHHPAIEADVELRLKLEHIATLSLQRSGGIPHADVCFNPRNSWQFAIVDQSSQWSTWSIRSINKKIGTWTVEAGKLGDIAEDLSDDTELVTGRKRQLDGWGAVRWVGDGCLLICNRTRITCHKLSNPPSQLPMPGLGLRKTKSRILDVREAPNNPEHLFVVTSSRIFWIHLTLEHTEMEDQPRLKVEILLTWVHFRNELDASLSVQVVELGLVTKAILYSRLTGLKTVFTFHSSRSISKLPSSVCDPYVFLEPDREDLVPPKCLALVLKALPHANRDSRGRNGANSWYIKCMTVGADLHLHECFMVANLLELDHPVAAPQSQGRPQAVRKSSYRVNDDFVVPNGMLDVDVQDAGSIRAPVPNSGEHAKEHSVQDHDLPPSPDQRTISLEWLIDHIDSTFTIPLDEALEPILSKISERIEAGIPGIVSLIQLIDQEIAVGDIEESSTALEDLLGKAENRQVTGSGESVELLEERIAVSRLTLSCLPPYHQGGSLSRTYDALVTSWITPLASKVPGRVRTKYERVIRCIAADLQLASYGLRTKAGEGQGEDESQRTLTGNDEPATFSLPVRGLSTFSQESRRVKVKAIEQAAAQLASSQPSNDQNNTPTVGLPTPEPTPSLRSQGSQPSQSTRSGTEDPAVQRLRALADIASQPPLPAALTGIINHWAVGQNPDDYDWERTQEIVKQGDEPEDTMEGARAKKKRRKERFAQQHMGNAVASSSRTIPNRPAASQAELPNHPQYSSQPTLVTASQPLPGPYGGAFKVKRGPRKAGF